MGRLSQALPSFLTPPRSKQHLPEGGHYESDEDSETDGPNGRGGRYRAPGRNGGNEGPPPGADSRRSSKGGPPPNSFVMPHERQRPGSFVSPADRAAGASQGSGHPNANTARRQTWGAPGTKVDEPPQSGSARDAKRPATNAGPNGPQSGARSVDDYRSALKDWKQQQNSFLSSYLEQYIPVMQRRFARTQPELEAALSPYCGSQELQICMRHWEQESKRFPNSGVMCANNMKAVGRDAWNELVMLDEQGANGQVLMENLRIKLDDVYKTYLKSVELSKENLWHTLDFNVEESPNMRQEVRETFWGSFDRFKVVQREHHCGLPILALPTTDVDTSRRA